MIALLSVWEYVLCELLFSSLMACGKKMLLQSAGCDLWRLYILPDVKRQYVVTDRFEFIACILYLTRLKKDRM